MQFDRKAFDDYVRLCRADGGLVVMPMLEPAGTVALNFGTYGGQGTWVGTPTFRQRMMPGYGYATTLDGSDDRVEVADNAALDNGDSVTFEAIVIRARTATIEAVMSRGSNSYYLRFKANDALNGLRAQVTDIGSTSTTFSSTIKPYHIVAVKSGSTHKTYVNGTEAGMSYGAPDTLTASSVALAVGCSYQPTRAEQGNMAVAFAAYYGTGFTQGAALRHWRAARRGVILGGGGALVQIGN